MLASSATVTVLIPSYNRPDLLKHILSSWLAAYSVDALIVVAEASSQETFNRYFEILDGYSKKTGRVFYKLAFEKLGSVKARNALLDMACDHSCEYIVMADDDYFLNDKDCLRKMVRFLDAPEIGAIGGKVVATRKRSDGDFFLNLPINIADIMSKISGYVFLDTVHGPRNALFLPPFFMLKKSLIVEKKIRYDTVYDTPTCFREESDFQAQIRAMGYTLLYNPMFQVEHLAADEGGNRPKITMGDRIYWKARNSIIFVWKWNLSTIRRLLLTSFCALILLLYRPWSALVVFNGIADGIHDYYNNVRVRKKN